MSDTMKFNILSKPYPALGRYASVIAIIGYCVDHHPHQNDGKKIELPQALKQFEHWLIIVDNDEYDDLVENMMAECCLPRPNVRHEVRVVLIATLFDNLNTIWDAIKPVEKPVISPYSFC